jgi:hypothetical protein
MVLRRDAELAARAAVDAARCARLSAWADRGETPPMDVVRACFNAEGVMMTASGEITMLLVELGAEWDAVERDGRSATYETYIRTVVESAVGWTGREKKFLKALERQLDEAHGVWDVSRGVGVVLRHSPLSFSQPFSVSRDSVGSRDTNAKVLRLPHTMLANGVRPDGTSNVVRLDSRR